MMRLFGRTEVSPQPSFSSRVYGVLCNQLLAEEIELRRRLKCVASQRLIPSGPEGRGTDWYPKLDFGLQ